MDYFNIKFIPRRPGIYIVGGTVRDFLLGLNPKDIDIAVKINPERVAEKIASQAGGHPVRIGKPGKIIYRVAAKDRMYDVVPINGDDIEADLLQRDFTTNAMAIDVTDGRLIDVGTGRQDLSDRVIRCVGANSLRNDPVRLLRAYRFAAKLNFSISPETLTAISRDASLIGRTAGERIREEWMKLLDSPASFQQITLMDATGLLENMFPEIRSLKGCMQNRHHRFDVFAHTMATFRHLEDMLTDDSPGLCSARPNRMLLQERSSISLIKHAALLHDIGKPATRTIDEKGNIHFYGHNVKGAEIAADAGMRIRLSKDERQYVDLIISNHMRPLALFMAHMQQRLSRGAVFRFFMRCSPYVFDLLLLSVSDMLAKNRTDRSDEFIRFARDIGRSWFDEYLPQMTKDRLITGHDLIRLFGLSPSPLFADILDYIATKRYTGDIRTRKEAIEAVTFFLDRQKHP